MQNTCFSYNWKSWRDKEKLLAKDETLIWLILKRHSWLSDSFSNFRRTFCGLKCLRNCRPSNELQQTSLSKCRRLFGQMCLFLTVMSGDESPASTTTAWRPTTIQKCPWNYDTRIKVDLVERWQTWGWQTLSFLPHETNALCPLVFFLFCLAASLNASPGRRNTHPGRGSNTWRRRKRRRRHFQLRSSGLLGACLRDQLPTWSCVKTLVK